MFQDVVRGRAHETRKWYTVPLSFSVHILVVTALIVAPLVAGDVLPSPRSMLAFVTPPTLPTAPAVTAAPPHRVATSQSIEPAPRDAAPVSAPEGIAPDNGLVPEPASSASSMIGLIDGLPGIGVIDTPPPPPAPAPIKTVRPGGVVTAPVRIKDVPPVYPPIAQSAHIEGDVIIEATIGPNGKVQDTRVLRSVPLLDQSAVTAVRSWEYTPTLLNGQPVAVIMTVTVRFRLR